MNERQQTLYERLRQFQFSSSDDARPFAGRLAEGQQWTAGFTARAIEEYRRYVLLACTSGNTVCPSEVVDEVWHLHLIYTRSYWQRFCAELLGQPLHHDPSRGGAGELAKHRQMYARTLLIYRETFGEEPPADIWPDVAGRFAAAPRIELVDRSRYWLLPKPAWRRLSQRRGFLFGAALVAPLATGPSLLSAVHPYDLRGPDFLFFFLIVAIMAMLIGFTVRAFARRCDSFDDSDDLDSYELAYLAGGAGRAVNAAVARLLQAGCLEMTQTRPPMLRTVALDLAGSHPLEQKVSVSAAEDSPVKLRSIHRACFDYFADANDKLRKRGLIVSLPAATVGLAIPLLTLLGLILFAVGKVMVGMDRDKPVAFLVILTIFTTIVGLIAFARPLFRTAAGEAYVNKARHQYRELEHRARLRPEELSPHQLATAFGLWGCGLVATGAFGSTLDRYERGSGGFGGYGTTSGCGGGGGSGCGGGGGCGGSGGCGGGCGGCGGS
jgi:uncharacterized protein (TIGR04222 family)